MLRSCLHPSCAGKALLAQRDAISNWDEFSAANDISGWNSTTDVCDWTLIYCTPEGAITEVYLDCYDCTIHATGTLAPELAAIK